MTPLEFLKEILPPTGMYCTVGLKGGTPKQTFVSTIEDLIETSNANNLVGYDTYFACANYNDSKKREKIHALEMKSLWVDIDCGETKALEGKGYATKPQGVNALKTFCKTLGLPKPYLVDSGRGLHAYWQFSEAISNQRWHPMARALKAAALQLKLIIDPTRTADAASILRIPGTSNNKDKDNPLPVTFIQKGAQCPADNLEGILAPYTKALPVPRLDLNTLGHKLDATTLALMGNYESDFGTIARKSLKGGGCEQIRFALTEQATLSEPLWQAALSIAQVCSDGKKAIHTLSMKHSGYDRENTIIKAAATVGPRTCVWYKTESGEGARCVGCKHSFTSPVSLGKKLLEVKNEKQESGKMVGISERVNDTEEVGGRDDDDGDGKQDNKETPPEDVVPSTLPEYPFPYTRGKFGGIYRKGEGADGEPEDVLLYENDLYVTKRIVCNELGECAVLKLKLPKDEVREFTLPLQTMQSPEKLRDALSKQGVILTRKNGIHEIMAYTSAFIKNLQAKMKADVVRTQFGWAEGSSKFILGKREIGVTSVGEVPLVETLKLLARHMEPKGSFQAWRDAFGMYKGQKGDVMAQVFSLMSAFGSPLIKFTGTQGALVSLVNTGSGTGKTSVLSLINSVWGQPEKLMLNRGDTAMSKMNRLGVMNCLPVCFDELTNYTPAELSDFVYAISQGRGRNRLRADANSERENNSFWNLIACCSGNAPIALKLSANKATSEGELMRLFEMVISLTEVDGGRQAMMDVEKNYGWAGEIYAKWLVTNYAKIPDLIEKARLKIEKLMKKLQIKERFWINTLCANYVGGVIAKMLGLHDYDMDAMLEWVCGHALDQRAYVEANIVNPSDMLGEFMNDNFGATLVIDEMRVNPNTMSNVFKPAQGKIVARVELHHGIMLVTRKDLNEYCVKRQGNLTAILAAKGADYKYMGTVKKRMTSGSGVTSPAVDAYQFEIFGEMLKELKGVK